ncbi:HlyD family secretion protein [Azospirillum thermophilum]|uniref:HlyD family efflux transporter periplasmic adaptor subunit n=1 Tax=Azospirillum thermophilum TaxID=2202148 RepID=A0A2S2CUD6_9PROT|nr:HlyD family efflux transporter periplasmic adaptor subunit [Azospirillum thermophilum]AWK88133.1 hypothetical protein DEW08_18575 [Azospirillum thermophilum]
MLKARHAANYRRPAPRIRVARIALLGMLGATFGWLALVNQIRVVGVGHIRAEEAIVSTLFEGRILALRATCNDRVAKGDLLALVGDPVRDHAYRGEMIAEETMARVRRIVQRSRIAVAGSLVAISERHAAAARRHDENAAALATAIEQAWRAEAVPLKERVAVLSARDRAREGLAEAEATLRRRHAELERLRAEMAAQTAGFAERVAARQVLAGLGGNEEIRAPFDGVVTECPRSLGDVIRPSVAIVRLQRAGSARIFVWVPAVELSRLREGMAADIVVSDSGRTLEARVIHLPLEVGPLPDSLRRYFWQNQTWQQYARIEVEPADPAEAATLPGDARVDAIIRLTRERWLPRDLMKAL